jgi:hypothetical protein
MNESEVRSKAGCDKPQALRALEEAISYEVAATSIWKNRDSGKLH